MIDVNDSDLVIDVILCTLQRGLLCCAVDVSSKCVHGIHSEICVSIIYCVGRVSK